MVKIAKKEKEYSFFDGVKRHQERTLRSRRADESRTAKKKSQKVIKGWMKNPAGSDVVGIDTKKHKAKTIIDASRWLMTSYKKSGTHELLKEKDFEFKQDKKGNIIDKKKAILTVSPRGHKTTTTKNLQTILNIRFNNVKVRSRKKKGKPDDFWISITKN